MYTPGPKHPWIGLLVLIVIRFVASGVGGTVTYREIQKWYRLAKEREVMDRMTAQKHIPAGEKVAIWLTAGERKLRSPDEQAGAEAVGQAARTTLHGLHGPIYS
jgi:hypothetical protein